MSPDQDTPRPDTPAADDELLMDGQEEVFSRTEVERGLIEHHSLEEDEILRDGVSKDGASKGAPAPRRHETEVNTDEAMAENFRSAFNPRP